MASHVVSPRLFRLSGRSAGVASVGHTSRATAGSAKAMVGATAAVSCTTRRSSGRASGTPLS